MRAEAVHFPANGAVHARPAAGLPRKRIAAYPAGKFFYKKSLACCGNIGYLFSVSVFLMFFGQLVKQVC
jgi:hypothetical protein